MKIEVAHRTLPMQGETRNGDAVFVRLYDDTSACFGVIDALGHGPHAAEVADRAIAHLTDAPTVFDAKIVMTRLHEALRGSRGAAATICTVRDGVISVAGVGNVAFRAQGASVPFVLSPGILGSRVHAIRSATGKIAMGDRIVLHSDGIASVFSLDPLRPMLAVDACAALFAQQRKATDDATALVCDLRPDALS